MIFTILKIMAYVLLVLFLFINISVWLSVRAPFNVLFAIPKIMYPNIVVPAVVAYVILMLVIIFSMFANRSIAQSIFLKSVMVFLVFFTTNSLVLVGFMKSSESTLASSSEISGNYSGPVTEYDEKDFNLENHIEISNLKLYIPQDSEKKDLLFLYLPYGNWRVHKDLSMSAYLKDTVVKNGYSFGYLSCSGRYESDIFRIVSELKRGIQLIKEDHRFGFGRIILSGGSAGAHLSLLTAFSQDIEEYDRFKTGTTVDGVVAFYSPTDILADYDRYVTNAGTEWYDRLGDLIFSIQDDYPSIKESHMAAMETLFGGQPDTREKYYLLASTSNLIHDGIPPVLLIHGEHDSMTSYEAARNFYGNLVENSCNADFVSLKFVDHAFDSAFQSISIPVGIAYEQVLRWLEKNY